MKVVRKNVSGVLFIVISLIAIVQFEVKGQVVETEYPKGFRLGITAEGNIAPAMSVMPTGKSQSSLKAFPAMGGEIGLEFSYYFAKYFGVQIGLDFGSRMQYRLKRFDASGNMRDKLQHQVGLWDFTIPVKMVFHYPVSKSVLLYSAVGINMRDIFHSPQDQDKIVRHSYGGLTGGHYGPLYIEMIEPIKFSVDMQLNVGMCYKFPYNDMIRGSVAANFAFRDKIRGFYQFRYEGNTGGVLNYRHNHIGLEIAYIHCFKTKEQRVKRLIMKNDK